MNSAFGEAALPAEAEQVLRKFLDGMSSFMINRVWSLESATQSDALGCPVAEEFLKTILLG